MTIDCFLIYSQDRKEEICQFLPNQSLDEYVGDLKTSGTYADHISIQAFASKHQCQVCIKQADCDDTLIGMGQQIVVRFLPNAKHYVSLEPMERYVNHIIYMRVILVIFDVVNNTFCSIIIIIIILW